MKIAGLFLFLILALNSCEKHDHKAKCLYDLGEKAGRVATDERPDSNSMANYKIMMKELGESDIRSLNHVAYVFELDLPYAQIYRFRVEQNTDSTFTLWSKAYGTATLEHLLQDSIPYRWININSHKSRLIESEQPFSRNEMDTFRNILKGSFYWAWGDPKKNVGSISEGPFWTLESLDETPYSAGKLAFHVNTVDDAEYGSYTLACLYLVQKSKLIGRVTYLRAYADYFIKHKGDPSQVYFRTHRKN